MQKTETTVLHNPGTLPVLTFPGFYRLSERGFMTAASHRGSELDRSRKKKLIPMYRAAAKKYRPLIGRHSLITCEDGLVIDILWEKRNFEHLCGVWCDRPPQVVHAGKTIEANYFFDQLIKGRLPSSVIHYSDYPRTRGKAEVLSNALDLEGNVDVVVDSDKAEVVYYLGGEAFRLEDALASVDAGRMPHVFPVDSFPSEIADGMTVGENGEHVGSGFNQD